MSQSTVEMIINIFFYTGMLLLLSSIVAIVINGGFFDIQMTVFSSSFREKFKKRLENGEKEGSDHRSSTYQTFIKWTGIPGIMFIILSFLYVFMYYG